MTGRLHITAAGMVTAVGLNMPASCAAMRARLDGFEETKFVVGKDWLIGAPIPLPRPWIGQSRLLRSATAAVIEVLNAAPAAVSNLELILCLSEADRPGRPITKPDAFSHDLLSATGLPRSTKIRLIEHGRPSGVVALERAQKSLARNDAKHVLIVGVDSYLTPRSVEHYLDTNRLLTADNANGFIAGEAAAAILCSHEEAGLRLCGHGLAREPAYIYNGQGEDGLDVPLRGDGMTAAYKLALDASHTTLDTVDYRICDLGGEKYFFKQTTLAFQRLLRTRHDLQDIWSPCEYLGNVGAAVVPIMIGMALTAANKGYAFGDPVLVEASSDDGSCGAAVFQKRVERLTRAA